ncbi:MAG: hypothetical protein JNJ45_06975 [Chthonomonas sp.]|nr:hypothetical protein [Chthonomonas sp.]
MSGESAPLEWQVMLPQAKPINRVIVGSVAVIVGVLGFLLTHNLIAGLFGLLAILGSSLELFFPLKFRLDEKSAQAKCGFIASEITWDLVQRVEDEGTNVLLSPFSKQSKLDRFRGVRLRFSSNREEVLAKIAGLWRKDEGTLEGGADAGADRSTDREDRGEGA